MLLCKKIGFGCAAVLLCVCVTAKTAFAEKEEILPIDKTDGYAFYLSEKTPYYRLSPHRCETLDADGTRQPRRIAAAYLLADLRQFGGKSWNALKDAGSPAYSSSPTITARSGTRYYMLSPEQAGMSPDQANKLRSIAAISYPFSSSERMRSALLDAGVFGKNTEKNDAEKPVGDGQDASLVTESELLTAVQTAIWRVAGKTGTLTDVYTKTEATGRKDRIANPDDYDGKAAAYIQTENRICAISDYLCEIEKMGFQVDQPLTRLHVAAFYSRDRTEIILRIRPNGTVNADDFLTLQVGMEKYSLSGSQGEDPVLAPDQDGCYTLRLPAQQQGKTIAVRLTGTQHTGKDVCLYVPHGGTVEDALVGVFGGTVEVDLTKTVSVAALSHRVRLRCVTEIYTGGSQIPLSDAKFSLYLSDADHGMTCVAENLISDADGMIEVDGLSELESGETYVFVQTEAPQGYSIPTENRIHADAASAVRMVNMSEITARATLELTDDVGIGLGGIPFELCRVIGMDTMPIGALETDSSGRIAVENLPLGNYRFIQQEVPQGYAATSMVHAFQIGKNGEDATISAKNLAYRSIEGTVRFEQCDPPESVLVQLLRDGEVCAEQTVSDETAWKFCFPDIPVLGDYSVVQTPIAGYAVETDGTDLINRSRRLELTISQRTESDHSLRGAVFSLRRADNDSHVRTTASDASGTLLFSDLSMGEYVLFERHAPAGIRAMEGPLYITIFDPNQEPMDDLPLQARICDAEEKEIENLCIVREKEVFFGLGMRGLLPIIVSGAVLLSALLSAKIFHKGTHTMVRCGTTRIHSISKRKPMNRISVFMHRFFREHWNRIVKS